MIPVAALYIDARGPYPTLAADVFCWGLAEDARKYDGPDPVVAHPPCRHWGKLRHLARVRCTTSGWSGTVAAALRGGLCPLHAGSDLSQTGACILDWGDRDCAPRAVEQVRAFGGVLEHPAGSKLWEACGLPHPTRCGACDVPRERCYCAPIPLDPFGGYTIELDQCEWGHVARKRTWLYLVGVPREALEAPPYPGREPSHVVSRDANRAKRNGSTKRRCSSEASRRTPPEFAAYMVRLARAAAESRKAA